uniref:Uncharacterized protein n=1 Tax=Rhodosorus marinus TaxID=101924 RepID=A0A7S3A951_9RHOD|mmetsp:Transcript_617/g.1328  ORF Transcript_617/g.1328 Transcript_617/m.1328 type:complete len:124 (+) Transcript_617:606-977(+)
MDLSDDKENHNQLTASVRFQDALSPKNNDATPSFLKELEESKEYDRAGNIVDDQVDVPDRLTKSLGVKSVVDDLQRFSVHVRSYPSLALDALQGKSADSSLLPRSLSKGWSADHAGQWCWRAI